MRLFSLICGLIVSGARRRGVQILASGGPRRNLICLRMLDLAYNKLSNR